MSNITTACGNFILLHHNTDKDEANKLFRDLNNITSEQYYSINMNFDEDIKYTNHPESLLPDDLDLSDYTQTVFSFHANGRNFLANTLKVLVEEKFIYEEIQEVYNKYIGKIHHPLYVIVDYTDLEIGNDLFEEGFYIYSLEFNTNFTSEVITNEVISTIDITPHNISTYLDVDMHDAYEWMGIEKPKLYDDIETILLDYNNHIMNIPMEIFNDKVNELYNDIVNNSVDDSILKLFYDYELSPEDFNKIKKYVTK